MKKIGILFGMENTFPKAFVDRVNSKKVNGVKAEFVSIDKVKQGGASEYAVIVDRISQDVPFYRAFLKTAAISGTAVLNNPFWWSADEKFFNNSVALSVGVAVPNTVLLPSHARPDDTSETSFRNLKFPIDWKGIFDYVGFPAYMKPHSGGGWKSVYRIKNADDLFKKHSETGQLVMMLQEEIKFTHYFRCYYLHGDRVHIMPYEPRNPHHLRYIKDKVDLPAGMLDKVREGVIKLNHALGYDFNTVEFAVRDGVPYAIDFCNPAPDADIHSVGAENFEWIVENAAQMTIERALQHKDGQMNLTWGNFIKNQMTGPAAKKKAAATTKKKTTKTATAKKDATAAKTKKTTAKTTTKKAATTTAKKAATTKKAATPKKATAAKKETATKAIKTTAKKTATALKNGSTKKTAAKKTAKKD